MHRLLSLLFSLFLAVASSAQFYIGGQEPAWTKWQQIETNRFKVIYPKEYDSLAFIYANHLETSVLLVSKTLKHNPRKFPVVLRTQNAMPNGFVSWAPRRMEIVTNYPSDADSETWLKGLSVHETRHVVQIDKLNRGMVRLGYFFFGESAVGAAAALVPLWFFEGDAVFAETALSSSGRGRQAFFTEPFRTHLLENGKSKYSYDKWLMGSYKNSIPNHYQFGYLMVGYGNEMFGSEMWANAIDFTSYFPFTFFPYYFSIKKDTKLSRKNLYKQAITYAGKQWEETRDTANLEVLSIVNQLPKQYTEYLYPQLLNDSTIFALKTTLTKIPIFVAISIKTGKEVTIHRPGYLAGKPSVCNGTILWSEYSAHPRFGEISYSDIYYIKTKGAIRVTKGKRLFNPMVSQNGKILAVGSDTKGCAAIYEVNFSGETEKLLNLCGLEAKEIARGNGSEMLIRATNNEGNLILRYKNVSENPDTILGPIHFDINNITSIGSQVYFTASTNSVENIYSINYINNSILNHGSSTYGLNYISRFNDTTIIASNNILRGKLPVLIGINGLKTKEYWQEEYLLFQNGIKNFKEESTTNAPSENKVFTAKPYGGLKSLFKVHSWAPFYYNPSEASSGEVLASPGVTLVSQNLTSTLASSVGYSYYKTHGYHAQVDWMGWYPMFSLGADLGNDFPQNSGGPNSVLPTYRSDIKKQVYVGVRVPLTLTSGLYYTQFTPGAYYSYSNDYIWNSEIGDYNKSSQRVNLYAGFYRLKRMAHRDLRSSLGLYLYVSMVKTPTKNDVLGNSYLVKNSIYLPGLLSNHSILINNQFEYNKVKHYFKSSRAIMPRGFNNNIFFDTYKSLSINYTFPLLYPDINIGALAYLKRIFINAFSDNALANEFVRVPSGGYYKQTRNINSVGCETFFDLHFFRTRYEFRLGYRAGYLLENNKYFHSFVATFDIGSLAGFRRQVEPYSINL